MKTLAPDEGSRVSLKDVALDLLAFVATAPRAKNARSTVVRGARGGAGDSASATSSTSTLSDSIPSARFSSRDASTYTESP
jgi:hypothetical protein